MNNINKKKNNKYHINLKNAYIIDLFSILYIWEIYKKYESEYQDYYYKFILVLNSKIGDTTVLEKDKINLTITLFSVIIDDSTDLKRLFVVNLNEWLEQYDPQRDWITSMDLYIYSFRKNDSSIVISDKFKNLVLFYLNNFSTISKKVTNERYITYRTIRLVWHKLVNSLTILKIYTNKIRNWIVKKINYIGNFFKKL